jgi:hypothetical protein
MEARRHALLVVQVRLTQRTLTFAVLRTHLTVRKATTEREMSEPTQQRASEKQQATHIVQMQHPQLTDRLQGCLFVSQPNQKRRERDETGGGTTAGGANART